MDLSRREDNWKLGFFLDLFQKKYSHKLLSHEAVNEKYVTKPWTSPSNCFKTLKYYIDTIVTHCEW